jgi:HicB family
MVVFGRLDEGITNVGDVTVLHFDMDPELHRRAKARAAIEGVPLKDWVARAIEHELEAEEADEAKRKGKR